ncbi:MAG: SMI1/KNR4 family protein [Bacillaceae bacterium]|nr:SMI1/KNR4 family protein [Bacillaceae bacterium]
MKFVRWRYAKEPIQQSALRDLERYFYVSLPPLYKEIMLNHNGARPFPNFYLTRKGEERLIKSFLPIQHGHPDDLLTVYRRLKNLLPKKVVPFANDDFGNYICLDYQESANPKVKLWEHEAQSETLEDVADDFNKWMSTLYIR